MTSVAVMAGLVPAIHVFEPGNCHNTWMPGTRPGMTNSSYFAAVSVRATARAADVPAVLPNTDPDIRPVPPG